LIETRCAKLFRLRVSPKILVVVNKINFRRAGLQNCRACERNIHSIIAKGGKPVTYDECRALQRLADVPRGIAKSLMLAYGFTDELIAGLVINELATVVPDIARIGKQTIEIELVIITDAGRKAIWNRIPAGRHFEVDRT
jgi:hypothetical protein